MVTKAQKKRGAWTIGWTSVSGKFVARKVVPAQYDENSLIKKVISPEVKLGKLRLGKNNIFVTESMGNYIKKAYNEGLKGLKTRKEISDYNKRFTEEVARNFGRTGTLFENIVKEAGMEATFKRRLQGKLSESDTAKFDDLAKMLKEINKDRIKSEMFYNELTDEFNIVGSKYEKMNSNFGTLSSEDVIQLTNSLNKIYYLAEVYVGRISRADYYAIHGEF